ncbi:MAG: restriction endonuclease subunit S [Oscillospiraceae bacterium]|nr:restriction endonuclease subunit S [Oscillospiraceae bacterium]MBR4093692.1 restriction endonuclease subunit S [Oscillospiraceae bacterium]MBR6646471.1 restriction endonuclease subunit S [Clostridia bacterium]
MALTKYKLGELIELSDKRNYEGIYTLEDIRGISTGKEFIDTKANMDGISLSSYKVVNNQEFAYVADTSRRGDKIAIAFNNSKNALLISSIYTVFRVSNKEKLLSDYLFMYFNRPEFDRYARFNSWGSARETFDWDTMCDIDIELPDLPTQQKYVDIYKAMVANQQSYERGLEDLKLVCDSYIENFSADEYKPIGQFIKRNLNRNQEKIFNKTHVKGFNNEGEFIKPIRLFSGDISTFKVIKKYDFVYNSRINSTIKKLSVALNEGDNLIVSPAYESFSICDTNELDPYYLYMLLQRELFAKKVLFTSFGSSTLVFGFDNLGEVKIPIPSIQIQRAIANIYKTYKKRRAINEKLKAQIKDICPILIKGAVEEGKA